MRVQIPIRCPECVATDPIDIPLNDDAFERVCVNGHKQEARLDLTVGEKILYKGEYELSRRDFSMSIVFFAMAFECELSRLFTEWVRKEAKSRSRRVPSDKEIEKTLREDYKNVRAKIEGVCRLLDPRGIDRFVEEHGLANRSMQLNLRVGRIAEDLQRNLFWPRNQILHFGYTGFQVVDAVACREISNLGLEILKEMDKAKEKALHPM